MVSQFPSGRFEAIEKKEKLTIAASKIDVYSQKESFSCPAPRPGACAASQLDFAGWGLGEGRRRQ